MDIPKLYCRAGREGIDAVSLDILHLLPRSCQTPSCNLRKPDTDYIDAIHIYKTMGDICDYRNWSI